MKTAMFFLLVSLTTLTSFAQREHLKFMGIPLNGSIDAFQTKLQAKGIKYDAKGSIQLKVGCRCFKGIFSGEKADFYVYYNEKSKIVYRAKAVISCINKEKGEEKFYSFRSMLKSKYSDSVASDDEQDGHPSFSIIVTDSKIERTMGYVGMYITNPPYTFMDEVYLHIDYEDVANKRENQSNNMDDL